MEDSSRDATAKPNGDLVDVGGEDESSGSCKHAEKRPYEEVVTLDGLLRRMISEVFFPSSSSAYASKPPLRRIKDSLAENVPLVPEASRNTGRDVLLWARRGSSFRALLILSIGIITLLALSGLLVFMLFFIAATANAVIISFLMSLAAAGTFLALFFASVTAIYIGALSIAVFVISTATISAIIAVVVASGWVAFFLSLLLATKKSISVAKRALDITGAAISSHTSSRSHHHIS